MRLFFALAGGYVALICLAIVLEQYYLLFAPAVLVIVYMAFYHLDKLLLLVVFCTPFSLNIEELGVEGLGLFLPTEPILFGILLIFIITNFFRSRMPADFLRHPVTVLVILHLLWMFMTCLTSENPMISWKYFLVRLWFLVPMYFLAAQVFRKKENVRSMMWLYLLPLAGAVVYTLVRHAMQGFSEEAGHWVMTPFFKDHTSYGAILALFFPAAVGMLFYRRYGMATKVVLGTIVVILGVGLIYSYTRAAWLSLAGAAAIYAAIRLKVRFVHIALVTALAGGFVALNWDQLKLTLEKNKSEHATEDFAERIESVSNISTDASNLERLNLWASAVDMFEERPVMGWGPGTFQFNYGSFQRYEDLTIISQKSGRSVNAHSEYLGPLAESGVFGMLSILLVIAAVLYTGFRLYHRLPEGGEWRMFLIVLLLGLITYYAHAVLNNYMDTDKASVPVWAMVAAIVAMDLQFRKNPKYFDEDKTEAEPPAES